MFSNPQAKRSVHLAIATFGITLFSTSVASLAQKQPSAFATLAAQADDARAADRLEEAVTSYRKALTLRPSWVEGWWWLATIEYRRHAYDEAADAFKKVTVQSPRNGTAFAMLGFSEFELGRDKLALEHIEKGLDIGVSKDITFRQLATFRKGILLQRLGYFGPAQELLERLCLSGAQTDDVANVLGMTLLLMADRVAPQDGAAADAVLRVGRAGCLAGQKKYDQGRPLLEQVVKDYPNFPNIHYAYGIFLLEVQDVPGSVEQLKQEIRNDPKHVLARLQIASAYYKANSAAGVPYAEEVVKLDPSLASGHYLLGLLLLDTNEYRRAVPELEIARESFPKDPKLYIALASAYSRAGRRQEAARARATFERLTKENPSVPGAGGDSGTQGAGQQAKPDTTNPGPN